jgi:hypothetical protein
MDYSHNQFAADLKGEIDSIKEEIKNEKEELKTATSERAIVLRESTAVLNSSLAARSATRDALALRLPLPISQGKINTKAPFIESLEVDGVACSRNPPNGQ